MHKCILNPENFLFKITFSIWKSRQTDDETVCTQTWTQTARYNQISNGLSCYRVQSVRTMFMHRLQYFTICCYIENNGQLIIMKYSNCYIFPWRARGSHLKYPPPHSKNKPIHIEQRLQITKKKKSSKTVDVEKNMLACKKILPGWKRKNKYRSAKSMLSPPHVIMGVFHEAVTGCPPPNIVGPFT